MEENWYKKCVYYFETDCWVSYIINKDVKYITKKCTYEGDYSNGNGCAVYEFGDNSCYMKKTKFTSIFHGMDKK